MVMTGAASLVEVQGTAEGTPFSRAQLEDLVSAAASGIERLVEFQRTTLAGL